MCCVCECYMGGGHSGDGCDFASTLSFKKTYIGSKFRI